MPPAIRKLKLEFDVGDGYTLYEIETGLPDYKLSFRLNQALRWKIKRQHNLQVFNPKTGKKSEFSLFFYPHDDFAGFYLLCPMPEQTVLLAVYYLVIRGSIHLHQEERIADRIAAVEGVFGIQRIQPNGSGLSSAKAGFIENLIYDLEYHLLDMAGS